MATISCIDAQKKRVEFTADSLAVAVATTDDLLTVPTEGAEQMTVAVTVTGAADLDAFEVKYIFYPGSSTAVTVASAGADYTTPNFPVLAASGDLTGLAAAATGWLILDTRGVYSVTFAVSSALAVSEVTIEGAAQ